MKSFVLILSEVERLDLKPLDWIARTPSTLGTTPSTSIR